jgi:hypothetical protein
MSARNHSFGPLALLVVLLGGAPLHLSAAPSGGTAVPPDGGRPAPPGSLSEKLAAPQPAAPAAPEPDAASEADEVLPPVATGEVLSERQIRWCLAEKRRIDAVRPVLDRFDRDEVRRFNERVANLNARCSSYRYFGSARQDAAAWVEAEGPRLEREAREAHVLAQQAKGSRAASSGRRPAPAKSVESHAPSAAAPASAPAVAAASNPPPPHGAPSGAPPAAEPKPPAPAVHEGVTASSTAPLGRDGPGPAAAAAASPRAPELPAAQPSSARTPAPPAQPGAAAPAAVPGPSAVPGAAASGSSGKPASAASGSSATPGSAAWGSSAMPGAAAGTAPAAAAQADAATPAAPLAKASPAAAAATPPAAAARPGAATAIAPVPPASPAAAAAAAPPSPEPPATPPVAPAPAVSDAAASPHAGGAPVQPAEQASAAPAVAPPPASSDRATPIPFQAGARVMESARGSIHAAKAEVPPAPSPGGDRDAALARLTQEVREAASMVLPRPDDGQPGDVTAQLEVRYAAAGFINSIGLAQSSGSPFLDEEALSRARALSLPGAPEVLRGQEFAVRFPVVFRARR